MELPAAFVERTRLLFGNDWPDFQQAIQTEPPVSIRLNDKMLFGLPERVPWCPAGRYLDTRPSFTLDPLFHAGCYYVQEASSMFVWQALEQFVPRNSLVLDLCAAPGGKSTLVSQFLQQDGFLVANEIIRARAYILAENLQKWGNGNFAVTNDKPENLGRLTALFDAILVDAPCSGEGMFRKDPEAIAEWSEDNVRMCAARQKEILASVWNALKPNGILIYSTCTYNQEENEENVRWMCQHLGATYRPLQTEPGWHLTDNGVGYHFYPHKTKGEGFFLAVVQKNAENAPTCKLRKNKRAAQAKQPDLKPLADWLLQPDTWQLQVLQNRAYAIPKPFADIVKILQENANVLVPGIELAEQKGNKWIPAAASALSKHLNRQKFTTFAADTETALAFLRTKTLVPAHLPLGYLLVTFQDVALGWVNNVGNRCNNLYPNAWRIRKK